MLKYIDKIIIFLDEIISKLWAKYTTRGFLISLFIHLIILTFPLLLINREENETRKIRIIKLNGDSFIRKETNSKNTSEEPSLPSYFSSTNSDSLQNNNKKSIDNFSGGIDTDYLNQEYNENTLNISLFYPSDWQFMDNKINNTFDAIIFFPKSDSKFNQQISVTIQVDKGNILFNPAYYDSVSSLSNMKIYWGKIEQVLEQVSQIFYIKTELTKENFYIQAIAPTREDFEKAKPIFYQMLWSFKVSN